MADTVSATNTSVSRGTDSRRGRRGGPQNRGGHLQQANGATNGQDGSSSRGRGGKRGRGSHDRTNGAEGGRSRGDGKSRIESSTPSAPAAKQSQPIQTNAQAAPVLSSTAGADDDVEAEVCFICASDISHQSVAPCNHRTCHICALRLRALYKTKACAHCRTEATAVIFTDEPEKRFEDFQLSDFYRTDENLGISYEKPEIFEDTVLLLRYNCPDETCDVACLGWPDLHRHVKSAHQKAMCDLCTRNKKVFTHEHELFTAAELKKHERTGDDNPGAADQSGFQGHPECGFCRQRFYGEDELYAHCRDRHERCHICDRRTGGNRPQYYVDYNALEQHFHKDHYPCLDRECLEKKFVVFESEMDLQAHQLEQHPNGLSRKDARRVDLSSFDYRPQYQESRRGGNNSGGGRRGRGRDPNAESTPATSSAHLSRAELAHQRAREIQSAQSVTTRTFGGQLSQPEPQAQTITRPPRSPRPTHSQPQPNPNVSLPSSALAEALTPQEQARRLRHATVTERAANLLKNDQVKLEEFRERISSFRNGTITAADLIEAFFSLFDTSSTELGKLIKELAEIFEVPGRADSLLRAWSNWKAINEDYPSLPGPSGVPNTTGVPGGGVGGSRILKLKSSTAQSSRSVGSKPWSAATGGGLQSRPPGSSGARSQYPSLPSNRPAGAATSSWLALRPASQSTSASSSRGPSRTHSSTTLGVSNNRNDPGAFPALPAAKKPTSTVFSPGYNGAGVRRINPTNSVNAWTAVSNALDANDAAAEVETTADGGGKKGKKGKKQLVLQWG